jgi:YbgC/YbaW family acyl-CoA thioester hydrolase
VQFAETDLAGIVHFSWYFRYMEEAEHALWRAAGLSIARADDPLGWPRVAAAFDYKSPLKFDDEFVVLVRIAAVTRRTIRYGFSLQRDGNTIGTGTLTAASTLKRSGGSMESIELPPDILERLRSVLESAGPNETEGI